MVRRNQDNLATGQSNAYQETLGLDVPNPTYRYPSTPPPGTVIPTEARYYSTPPPGTEVPLDNTKSFTSARTHVSDRDFLRTNMTDRFNNPGASTSGNPVTNPLDTNEPPSPSYRQSKHFRPNEFPLSAQAYGNDPFSQFQRPSSMQTLPEGYVPLQTNIPHPYYSLQQPPYQSSSNIPIPSYFQQPPVNTQTSQIDPPNFPVQQFPSQAPNIPAANTAAHQVQIPPQNIPTLDVRPPPDHSQNQHVPLQQNVPQAHNNQAQNIPVQNVQQTQVPAANQHT